MTLYEQVIICVQLLQSSYIGSFFNSCIYVTVASTDIIPSIDILLYQRYIANCFLHHKNQFITNKCIIVRLFCLKTLVQVYLVDCEWYVERFTKWFTVHQKKKRESHINVIKDIFDMTRTYHKDNWFQKLKRNGLTVLFRLLWLSFVLRYWANSFLFRVDTENQPEKIKIC